MEQLYMIEVFVDTLSVFVREGEDSAANKNLIAIVKFGPGTQFVVKENQLAIGDTQKKDDVIECDAEGRRKWSRTLRTGKAFMFPSYPDTILAILSKFPLEFELWNDDVNEEPIFVGVGKMVWDKSFFQVLKETSNASKLHEPFAVQQKAELYAECCGYVNGQIGVIVRLNALGSTIITEYQQLPDNPEHFVFRTNKTPNMFYCKRVMGDDPNFTMIGSLYETTTLENPDLMGAAKNVIDVCTELTSCGAGVQDAPYKCHKDQDMVTNEENSKAYAIDKIRMGDITGPCGNTNCALAHKVKTYIRNLESYKKKAASITETKTAIKEPCGTCICKDEKWHRKQCPERIKKPKDVPCTHCGGALGAEHVCEDNQNQLDGTALPEGTSSNTKKPDIVNYVFNVYKVPNFKDAVYRNCNVNEDFNTEFDVHDKNNRTDRDVSVCCCRQETAVLSDSTNFHHNSNTAGTSLTDPHNQSVAVYAVTEIQDDKDCRCQPPQPSPACNAFDCECKTTDTAESSSASRKTHKPFCTSYKHKISCPNNMNNIIEENNEEEEDETQSLLFGLPPIKLGPCPVLCRPCSVPHGFARMYNNAHQPLLPPSYSDAGKVCCAKEMERIKEVLKQYTKYEKDDDFRCLNQFLADTEKRCCDKEQLLMSFSGKGCCRGQHETVVEENYIKNLPD